MVDLTFLETDQIFGKGKLEIFKKYGTKAAISDFAILLGGFVSVYNFTSKARTLESRTGLWWTKTNYCNQGVRIVDMNGNNECCSTYYRDGGNRPAFSFFSLQQISPDVVRNHNGFIMIEMGVYPQKACPLNLQKQLEATYAIDMLTMTGVHYTTDARSYGNYQGFIPREYIEYEYQGKRFVRVEANFCNEVVKLSNGKLYRRGDYVWVEVSPIVWLVDEHAHVAITKDLLFAGIQFNNDIHYDGDFESTDIKRFLDNYFAREIQFCQIYHQDKKIKRLQY